MNIEQRALNSKQRRPAFPIFTLSFGVKIACLILAVCLGLGVTLQVIRAINNRALNSRLSIEFVAWTNTAGGDLAVVFAITNVTRQSHGFYWMDPETLKDGRWPSKPRDTLVFENRQGVVDPYRNSSRRIDGSEVRFEELAAGQGTTVCVGLVTRQFGLP